MEDSARQKKGFGKVVVALSRRCLRWPKRRLMVLVRRRKKSQVTRSSGEHQLVSANNTSHHDHHDANGNALEHGLLSSTDTIMSVAKQKIINSAQGGAEEGPGSQLLSGGESSAAKGDESSANASAAMNGGAENKNRKKQEAKGGPEAKQGAEKKDSQQQQQQQQGEGPPKLSNAELKKRAKAEKAARRAKEKQEREGEQAASAQLQNQQQQAKKGGGGGGGAGKQKQGAPAAGTKQAAQRRGSVHVPAVESKKKKKSENENIVAVFGHLPWHSRRAGIAGVGKEIHPAVVALGMQLRDYVICGSSARCVATLLALRRVVQAYITPIGTSLSRHLTTYLSHQINYLTTCRPLSISQGNAIRALKLEITTIDPGDSEDEAKQQIYDYIDNYIREKYTVASQVIANSAADRIKDGDVILCYAGSSVVQKALLTAHAQGKKFRVSIIDTRPLFEGRNFARTLSKAGLEVQYSLINGITTAIRDVTKVFLGAHAMTSNGCLFSRVGTALVAMSAKERVGGINIPVIVCCETAKFTDRVALDSIVVNEIADADELVAVEAPEQVTNLSPPTPAPTGKGGKAASTASSATNADTGSIASSLGPTSLVTDPSQPLQNWREMKNLQLLNIMHDVTPAQYIDMVITEMGSLPPSAVPIVHRMSTESEEKDAKH
ncbi:conserved hypothetical protein [Uncinocarpus reesii 1704]|uniref:Translation initiation factor eIF2B subunit delta n=1 Tax=Uncinocarpus reesii (strain UAMH 1704) TaxID=336963 RepID=C4JRD2_UNCRE|nr:uncharacterized protein UREG_05021 [Uncinocarpus reesii 1704]EEP80179.1 conserved hypothetical protein [Uncinocarpus reesii 1704]